MVLSVCPFSGLNPPDASECIVHFLLFKQHLRPNFHFGKRLCYLYAVVCVPACKTQLVKKQVMSSTSCKSTGTSTSRHESLSRDTDRAIHTKTQSTVATKKYNEGAQRPIHAQDVQVYKTYPAENNVLSFWSDNGYLLIDDLFDAQLLTLAQEATLLLIEEERGRASLSDEGCAKFQFPFADPGTLVLNKIPMHTRLNQLVMSLLGTEHYEILLSKADIQVQRKAVEQPLHLDLSNQASLMLPDMATDTTGAKVPEALTALVYLDEGDDCGGKELCELNIFVSYRPVSFAFCSLRRVHSSCSWKRVTDNRS